MCCPYTLVFGFPGISRLEEAKRMGLEAVGRNNKSDSLSRRRTSRKENLTA